MYNVAIETDCLKKSYGVVEALSGVSLSVRTGTIFGLLGPNGAGKTSLIEILEGLRPKTGGSVSVLGLDPTTQSLELKDRIGVCLQDTNFPDKVRVSEVLDLFSAIYSRTVPSRSLLARFGLLEKRNAFYSALSGGQRQRLAVALALINDPELVFLDEPTAGLDAHVRREIHGLIESLPAAGRTVMLTTHYIEEAAQLCDYLAIIQGGKIIALGTPTEIIGQTIGSSKVTIKVDQQGCELPSSITNSICSKSGDGREMSFNVEDPASTINSLVYWLDSRKVKLLDIEVTKATLEDAFIELTGSSSNEA